MDFLGNEDRKCEQVRASRRIMNHLAAWKFITRIGCLLWSVPFISAQEARPAISISLHAKLQGFNVQNGAALEPAQFTAKARIDSDPTSGKWLIQYVDNGEKYVCSFRDFILAKPAYDGSNAWYMVSDYVEGYPVDLDPDERLLWFVYCAKDYLRNRQGQPVVLPTGDTRLDCYTWGCRLTMEWQSEGSLCPASGKFTFDPVLFKKGLENLELGPDSTYLRQREKRCEQYLNNHALGQTVAEFTVQGWTNSAGMQIPVGWTLDFYWYGKIFYTYVGATERFEAVEYPPSSHPYDGQDNGQTPKKRHPRHQRYNVQNYKW